VAVQAIQFWSTVCECEIAVIDDLDSGITVEYFRIIEQAAPTLIPILLETLTKQNEDLEMDDSVNIAEAGAVCIDFIAQTIGDSIVDYVLPFVTTNVQNPNWRLREASLMAFGSILEGINVLKNCFVSSCLLFRQVRVKRK
jgi:importin subunit beta-1